MITETNPLLGSQIQVGWAGNGAGGVLSRILLCAGKQLLHNPISVVQPLQTDKQFMHKLPVCKASGQLARH